MNGLGKDYIWSELFQNFNAAFLRNVEEIAHAITDLYCTVETVWYVGLRSKTKLYNFWFYLITDQFPTSK